MFYIGLAICFFGVDFIIKKYVEENKQYGKEEEILDGKVTITKYHNSGIFCNVMEKKPNLVLVLSGGVLGAFLTVFARTLMNKKNHFLKFSMALIAGGALSNVYDRIKKGYVVDYFSFPLVKIKKIGQMVFNLSDMFILIGSVMVLLKGLVKEH